MIFGLLGSIGSGKNTVADLMVEHYHFRRESFAGSLKDAVACIFGWPRPLLEGDTVQSREWREKVDSWWAAKLGIPAFSPRLALQLVGTELFRDNFHKDIWLLSLQYRLQIQPNSHTVISDARFRNEIVAVRELGGVLVHVDRGLRPEWWDTAIKAWSDPEADHIMCTVYKHIHQSEWEWVGCTPDYVISNDGTLEELYSRTHELWKLAQRHNV